MASDERHTHTPPSLMRVEHDCVKRLMIKPYTVSVLVLEKKEKENTYHGKNIISCFGVFLKS